MPRQPFVAGSFYPGEEQALLSELNALVPPYPETEKEEVIGALVPHAGYLYSGRVAGEVYARVKNKKTFVLIGPNHTGRGHSFSLSMENWSTPLGDVEVDVELAEEIKRRTPLIKDDPSAHRSEHSIEVQLPFVKKLFPDTRIVPLCVSSCDISELRAVAEAVTAAALSTENDIAVLASSDMTHYEPREEASIKDKKAIDAILSMDAEHLVKTVKMNSISMCGWAPLVIMISASGQMGGRKARLLRYSDSGEITGNLAEVVGYAGMIVTKK